MRVPLAITLKNKTSSLARDARLLNAVVDTKNRVQKRPSLVATYGPVTAGNGLGLFVRNTPNITDNELVAITGSVLTTAPFTYGSLILVAQEEPGNLIRGYWSDFPLGSLTPDTFKGVQCVRVYSYYPPADAQTDVWFNSAILTSSFFSSVKVGSITYYTSSATFTQSVGSWVWPTNTLVPSTGTYAVIFI